jgi:enoyl-CoA hydratase/carnithine racemase
MIQPSFRRSAPDVPDTVVTCPSPHILLVTLDRPKALNAIPAPHHATYARLWQWYDSEPCLRCAIITGKGRAFCAGADLKEWNLRHQNASESRTSSPSAAVLSAVRDEDTSTAAPSIYAAGFAGLSNRSGKKPVIAAVNGLCFGGGMEMALNCDMIISSADALFGLPEVRIGVVALAGALPRLVRTVGKQRASEMALLGRRYGAEMMQQWGIVNAVVPKGEDVVREALRWATELAHNSPDSVIVSREGLRLGWEDIGPVEATEELGRGLFAGIEAGENMQEGIRSFVESRRPRWVDSKL